MWLKQTVEKWFDSAENFWKKRALHLWIWWLIFDILTFDKVATVLYQGTLLSLAVMFWWKIWKTATK